MPRISDSKYRDIIVQDLDSSILVEAGAGSGKTTSLINRMLALIGTGKCRADKMAAVTFTRKAAAELKSRFQIELERAIRKTKDKSSRERYERGLSDVDLLFTGTIHSFCARLLRERPVEAKLDPEFQELEEEEDKVLRDRCWDEHLESLQSAEAPILDELLELGIEPSKLAGTFERISVYPEVEVSRVKQDRPDFTREKQLLRDYVNQAWTALPRQMPEPEWDDLQSAIREAWFRLRRLDLRENKEFIEVIKGLEKNQKIVQKRWADKNAAKTQLAIFETFRTDVVDPSIRKWREYCHFFIMGLVVPAVDYFSEVRKRNSLMNYHDLLISAARLLSTNPEVRQYLQERFTRILVDEFQDTDPIQAEVLLYLAGKDYREESWRKTKVRPGSLFIVGDPKQSIYRFRRADIATYNEVKRIIEKSGGLHVPLTTNFRSFPSICEWANAIFRNKFPAEATPYQPAFEPLVPHKSAAQAGVKRITIGDIKWHRDRDVAGQDAEKIGSWLDWALKGGLKLARTQDEIKAGKTEKAKPGDFMILLRYKDNLSLYARALEARGIPYEISGGAAFNESEELRHIMNLLAAVAEPEDQVALIAALRGIFYGISDDLLYRFRKGRGFFSYLARDGKCADETARERIEGVFSELLSFHKWSKTKPPAAALSMILDRLGIVPLARTREMGESRSGNLMKLIEMALGESVKGITSFPEMVESLREYFSEVKVEEMSLEPGKVNAVRVMNLHKAKGLEAEVVFLADPLKSSDHDPELYISRMEERAVGRFVASERKGEYGREIVGLPVDWDKYGPLEQEYQRAEEERLLYVAVTRAKQLLVVSRYPAKPEKGSWKDLYPHLEHVEELEAPQMEKETAPRVSITPEAFAAGKAEIAKRFRVGMLPSYEVEAVTKATEALAGTTPFSRDTGKGMSWGRIVHTMLEAAAKGGDTDLELLAENLLKEEDRLLSEKDSLMSAVRAVVSSGLWKRMGRAQEVLVEVPFALKVDEKPVPKIMSGVIDLAFKEPDGWVIADYKTDKVDGNLEKLVAYYRPQVEMYRTFWREMSGEKVKEAGLYFTESGMWIQILQESEEGRTF